MRCSRALLRSASSKVSGPSTPPSHVTILGGGLTGLAAAHHLRQSLPSTKITVIEASPRFGGWLHSSTHEIKYKRDQDGMERVGSVFLESGPRTIRPGRTAAAATMLKMIKVLNLEYAILSVPMDSPSAKQRYFLNFDTDPPTLKLVGFGAALLKPSTLFAALMEPFRMFAKHRGDESVYSFLRGKFGSDLAALGWTGLHGIYAASATELSAQATLGRVFKLDKEYGSVVLGDLRSRFSPTNTDKDLKRDVEERWDNLGDLGGKARNWALYGLRGGLQTLSDRLYRSLRSRQVDLRSSERIQRLEPSDDGSVRITTDKGTMLTDHTISCMSSTTLSSILASPLPNLTANPSASVGVVNFVFPRSPASIHPNGFGYLVPYTSTAQNPASVLGVLFDSTALPVTEEDEGLTKMTIIMGGPYWSTYPADGSTSPLAMPSTPEELVQPALQHLRTIFPVLKDVEPALVVPSLHKDCIPTYLPGHYDRLSELQEAILDGPWAGKLSLAGASYYSPAVNDCVWSAAQIASALGKGHRPTGLEWLKFAM